LNTLAFRGFVIVRDQWPDDPTEPPYPVAVGMRPAVLKGGIDDQCDALVLVDFSDIPLKSVLCGCGRSIPVPGSTDGVPCYLVWYYSELGNPWVKALEVLRLAEKRVRLQFHYDDKYGGDDVDIDVAAFMGMNSGRQSTVPIGKTNADRDEQSYWEQYDTWANDDYEPSFRRHLEDD